MKPGSSDEMTTWVFADLGGVNVGCGRLFGPGLGNMLFPWARSVVAAEEWQLGKIWPNWPQLKLGPSLRRSQDGRFYTDLFAPTDAYATGFEKLVRLTVSKRVREQELSETYVPGPTLRPRLVVFSGHENLFSGIRSEANRRTVVIELLNIARKRHLNAIDWQHREYIAVHVRLGDFRKVSSRQPLLGGETNCRIPLEWYCDTIRALRSSLGREMPVRVHSDGHEDELSLLLRMPNVRLYRAGSSLGDLFSLAFGRVLIASGSTFSMWASYLGGMPSIWHSGQLRQDILGREESDQLWELERVEGEELPPKFLAVMGDRGDRESIGASWLSIV